jgi:hypothetical protein
MGQEGFRLDMPICKLAVYVERRKKTERTGWGPVPIEIRQPCLPVY